jgi:ArsR family transcriptional regulator, arsenate/arsenite/antimonite-responsive transcriptional repressor
MAASKKETFTKDDIRIARFAKALSHPARISILRNLANAGESCFNEISGALPLADSTVSQHLSELKEAGLLKSTYDPPRVIYSIDYVNWKTARRSLKELARAGKKG